MGAYKIVDTTDTTVTVSCGCRGRKAVTFDVEHLQRMADESHDMLKAAEAAGVAKNHNRPRVMRTAMQWALDQGHIDAMPKGW